jgi:hypothetical protein
MNKGDNLYGSARWGTGRDLKKFGLIQKIGIVLVEFRKAELAVKVNPKNASVSLVLKKLAPQVCHSI